MVASGKRNKRVWIAFEDLESHAIIKAREAAEAAQLAQCPHCSGRKLEPLEAIEQNDLEESMHTLSSNVRPWDSGRFRFVSKLQDAPRNYGCVAEMLSEDDGLAVAVKRMPNWWVQSGQDDFRSKYPKEVEQPWRDAGLVKGLQDLNFPHVCNLVSIFRDQRMTYMVSSLATKGDLFSWAQRQPSHSDAREQALRPIVAQLLDAVRWLHDLGVAHGDLSLENILITHVTDCSKPQLKLIDFGMATLGRKCTPGSNLAGKDMYRAPEAYAAAEYDAFLADAFSLGVALYAMVFLDYPWKTTKPGKSDEFDYVRRKGAETFLKTKTKVRGKCLTDLISPGLIDLMAGLLAPQPGKRLCLGETCLLREGHVCAWKSRWLPCSLEDPVACCTRVFSNSSVSTMAPDSEFD